MNNVRTSIGRNQFTLRVRLTRIEWQIDWLTIKPLRRASATVVLKENDGSGKGGFAVTLRAAHPTFH
jgi:hypothetical protein